LTVGIEEEYMLLDPAGYDLVSGVEELLDRAAEGEMADRLKPELMQCVLESGTVVCDDIAAAAADLRLIRQYVGQQSRALGMRLGAAGTHPFSLFENQKITARDRYRALVEMLQYVARRELVFGMHVHVAVPSPEACLAVMEGVLIELPVLLALSANSPFWRGDQTGLASTRAMVFSSFPRSGLPPRFHDYGDYAQAVGFMETTGAIGDYTHLWWDVRPHPRFGTLELRVMDCQTRIEDAIALAAYVQCLVKLLLDRYLDGQEVLSYHRMLLSENKWLALRYGMDAPLMDLAAGKRVKMSARTLAKRRLRELRPIARSLGCADALSRIDWILDHGNGAHRQLQVWNANRDIAEVAEEIAIAAERV
jgi:glutamate---cysteine ligase / carboxylate-amine ligase